MENDWSNTVDRKSCNVLDRMILTKEVFNILPTEPAEFHALQKQLYTAPSGWTVTVSHGAEQNFILTI